MSAHLAAPRTVLDLEGVSTDARAIAATRRGQSRKTLWIADLSQLWAFDAWLYFAFVLDRRSRRCLGFASHRTPHADLLAAAIREALVRTGPASGASGRPPALVLTRRCHLAGVDFPRWAVPAAPELALAGEFASTLRSSLLDGGEADSWPTREEAVDAVRAWAERYNPSGPPA